MLRFVLTSIAVFLCATSAFADCPGTYVNNTAPRVVASDTGSRELCYTGYAAWESTATRTPLWSAEHLTRASIASARYIPRQDHFHADTNLPRGGRAELTDYVRSGYDRGHLAPSGDMPSIDAQEESFSLGNIVPQNSDLNRGLWAEIEMFTRDLAERDGEVYVVTGPIFSRLSPRLRGHVQVPVALYKAIYDTQRHQGAAFIAMNANAASYQVVSLAALRTMANIDAFPALPDSVKAHAMVLPPLGEGRQQVAAADRERLR